MSVSDRLVVRASAESRVGNARGNNEDNVYFNGDFITPHTIQQDFAIKTGEPADLNCFAVFDGMGRNNTGSYASLLAATRLDELIDRLLYEPGSDIDAQVLSYIQQTNTEVRNQINETGGVRTATTVALVLIVNGNLHAYNAGDSRIYLYRDNNLMQLSRDHVSASGQRSVILTDDDVRNGGLTKYLGIMAEEGELEPFRAKPFKIKKGDKILICSDGLSDYVDDDSITACLSKPKDPFGHTNELMKSALAFSSADNISAIVIEVGEPGFKPTKNMILIGIGIAVFLLGLMIGILFGYRMGLAGFGRKEPQNYGFNDDLPSGGYTENITDDNGDDDFIPEPASNSDTSPSDASPSDTSPSASTLGSPSVSAPSGSTVSTSSPTLYPPTTHPTSSTKPILVESLTIAPEHKDFTLNVGKTQQIIVTVIPTDIPEEYVTWTSDDTSKVTVDEKGLVTAVAPGKAEITVKIGKLTDKCIVRVRKPK